MAVALLLVVTAHAAAPPAEAMSRTAGSAFNSATADVSLKVRGNMVVVREALRMEPPTPRALRPDPAFSLVVKVAYADYRLRHEPRGPPAAATTFLPLSPRAPPAV